MNLTGKIGILSSLFVFGATIAQAQTCGTPGNLDQTGVTPTTGTTCSGDIEATELCGAFGYTAGTSPPQLVYSFTYGTAATATTLTLSGLGAAYTKPAMFVTDSACTDAGDCPAAGTTSIDLTSLTKGTSYILFITGVFNQAATDCGTFSLAANGVLPVKLQNFSIN